MGYYKTDGTRCVDVYFDKNDVREITNRWKQYVNNISPYPNHFNGKGIVICAGGIGYFTCSWILISTLRNELKCTLPIQIWYFGNELSEEIIYRYGKLNVSCHNILDYERINSFHGWMLKPLAIKYSSFKEILYLDADNVCTVNPEHLFGLNEYKKHGTVFWPDFWHTDKNNQIWEIVGVRPDDHKEQESGQILINKKLCWRELNLTVFFNMNHQIYYNFLLGDKDTFRFAWLALGTPFYFIEHQVASCGYLNSDGVFCGQTMVQHLPNGQFGFLHRNLLKWDVTEANEKIWKIIRRYKDKLCPPKFHTSRTNDGLEFINMEGDIEDIDFNLELSNWEEICLAYLNELREEEFYKKYFIYSYIQNRRTNAKVFLRPQQY